MVTKKIPQIKNTKSYRNAPHSPNLKKKKTIFKLQQKIFKNFKFLASN